MIELIDERTKKRLDTISECFDLEDYFKKIESIKNKININNKKYMFEIFGFDFMIDEEKKWFTQKIYLNSVKGEKG